MKRIPFVAAVAVLALPTAAQAHVTVNPRSVVADSFARLDVRVPNERDDASTKSVAVSFPEGFTSVSYKPVWGWKVKIAKAKLATPIKTADGEITDRVARINGEVVKWTGPAGADLPAPVVNVTAATS